MKSKFLIVFLFFFAFASFAPAQTKKARKLFDLSTFDCEELKIRSYDFAYEINKASRSKGYVIVYEGKDQKSVYDKNGKFEKYKYIFPLRGQLNQRIQGIRGMLNFIKAPLEQIKIVNGGLREKFAIEYWIVPNGGKSPRPMPTLNTMKYRKGKIHKFIYLDC